VVLEHRKCILHELLLLGIGWSGFPAAHRELGQPDRTIAVPLVHAVDPAPELRNVTVIIVEGDVLDETGIAVGNNTRTVAEKLVQPLTLSVIIEVVGSWSRGDKSEGRVERCCHPLNIDPILGGLGWHHLLGMILLGVWFIVAVSTRGIAGC